LPFLENKKKKWHIKGTIILQVHALFSFDNHNAATFESHCSQTDTLNDYLTPLTHAL